jgi:hypothetical protein
VSDSPRAFSYTEAMTGDGAHIRLKLDTEEPMALSDFVGSFTGLGNQFDKFVAAEHPGTKMLSEFYVKEVRAGCIEADLVAMVAPYVALGAIPGVIDAIDKAQVLTEFVKDIGGRISPYFSKGGRNSKATKSDLADFLKAVSGIARDPRATGRLEAAVFASRRKRPARLNARWKTIAPNSVKKLTASIPGFCSGSFGLASKPESQARRAESVGLSTRSISSRIRSYTRQI